MLLIIIILWIIAILISNLRSIMLYVEEHHQDVLRNIYENIYKKLGNQPYLIDDDRSWAKEYKHRGITYSCDVDYMYDVATSRISLFGLTLVIHDLGDYFWTIELNGSVVA